LSELLNLSHGKCCALTAIEAARYNAGYETPALRRLCGSLGIESVADLPSYLRRLRTSLEDFDTLADVGFRAADIAAIAKQARTSMMENNGKYADQSDLEWILAQALGIGAAPGICDPQARPLSPKGS
jgi:alcohol dehydrogenase class IV